MDQPMGAPPQAPPAPIQPVTSPPPPPIPPVQGPPPPTAPSQKKSNAWIWILGGCLGVVILGIIVFVALGWWGARKVKKEMEKYTPSAQKIQENINRMNKEAEEWEKKSKEFQESLPNPEGFPAGAQNPQ